MALLVAKGGRFQDRQCAEDRLQALVDAIPATWKVAAVIGQGVPVLAVPLPSTAVMVHTHMLDRLGWAHPTVAARTIGLSALTLKTAATCVSCTGSKAFGGFV